MSRICRWGRHLPGRQKIFNNGRQFTQCVDCGETLVVTHRGWREPPPGKRVVWRERTPSDRLFTVQPNFDRARLGFDLLTLFRRR